jgi:hypothetical protein
MLVLQSIVVTYMAYFVTYRQQTGSGNNGKVLSHNAIKNGSQ